jgi:hypothetical protein
MSTDRCYGEVLSIDKRGAVTVRRADDKLIIVSASEVQRAGVRLEPGVQITFRIDEKAVGMARAVDPALVGEEAAE